MYAIDDLGDAIDVTREFLTPVRAGTWLRLALVVFFVTGLGFVGPSAPTADPSAGTGGLEDATFEFEDPDTGETIELEITADDVLFVATVLLVVFGLLWTVVALLASIMDFVLLESLRRGEVHVRRYGREHLGRAMGLFGFRFVATALAYGPFLIVAYRELEGVTDLADVDVGTLVAVGAVTAVLAVVHAVVVRLTREFVVPVMALEERGVLSGWRRFWTTISANPAEYVVYYVASWFVGLVAAVALGVLAVPVGVVLAIPVVILAVLAWGTGTAGLVAVGIAVLVALALFLLALVLFEVPVVTYLRYYALLVLGDTDGGLDLIPQRRAAVRGGGRGGPDGSDRWVDPGGDGRGRGPDRDDSGGDGWDRGSGWDVEPDPDRGGSDWGDEPDSNRGGSDDRSNRDDDTRDDGF